MSKSRDPRDRYYPQQLRRILERAAHAKLGAEEYGVFRFLVDLMWIEGGPVADDARWLAAQLRMSVRAFNARLHTLVALGLMARGDGYINDAATYDSIVAHRTFRLERAASGRRGVETRERKRPKTAPVSRENAPRSIQNNPLAQAQLDAEHQNTPPQRPRAIIDEIIAPINSVKPASSARENASALRENNPLAQAEHDAEYDAERHAISKIGVLTPTIEGETPAPGKEGKDAVRARFDAARAEMAQQHLKLGPVVIARNSAVGGDGASMADGGEHAEAAHEQARRASA